LDHDIVRSLRVSFLGIAGSGVLGRIVIVAHVILDQVTRRSSRSLRPRDPAARQQGREAAPALVGELVTVLPDIALFPRQSDPYPCQAIPKVSLRSRMKKSTEQVAKRMKKPCQFPELKWLHSRIAEAVDDYSEMRSDLRRFSFTIDVSSQVV
jgi:hypothetical protein